MLVWFKNDVRLADLARAKTDAIQGKHGSRKAGLPASTGIRGSRSSRAQLDLF